MSRTVLITGASRGIGRAVAEHCLAEGHRLCLGLRDPAAVKGTPLDNAHVLPVAYDASQPEQATSLVDAATSWAGGVDALIHCAGILHRTPLLFEDGQEAELEELWRVNVMGPWRTLGVSGSRFAARTANLELVRGFLGCGVDWLGAGGIGFSTCFDWAQKCEEFSIVNF